MFKAHIVEAQTKGDVIHNHAPPRGGRVEHFPKPVHAANCAVTDALLNATDSTVLRSRYYNATKYATKDAPMQRFSGRLYKISLMKAMPHMLRQQTNARDLGNYGGMHREPDGHQQVQECSLQCASGIGLPVAKVLCQTRVNTANAMNLSSPIRPMKQIDIFGCRHPVYFFRQHKMQVPKIDNKDYIG
eukprot:3909942-Amphidinium_carterae.1